MMRAACTAAVTATASSSSASASASRLSSVCATRHDRTPLDTTRCHRLRAQLAAILIVWIATEHNIAAMMSYGVAAAVAKLNRVERLAMLGLLANVLHCRIGEQRSVRCSL